MFGLLGIACDQIYLKGLQDRNLDYFKLARYYYPFDKELIVTRALTLIRSQVVDKITYDALKDALSYDPYSIEMLGMYIQYANVYGSKEDTIKSYKLLKQIGLNSNNLKQLNSLNIPILKGL